MTRVLITGATGFVGRPLCRALLGSGFEVRAAVRSHSAVSEPGCEPAVVGDIDANTDWSSALNGVDVIVHAAARVHVMNDRGGSGAYDQINVEGTRRLATEAARAGVRRFLFLSTVKVNGENTPAGPFTAGDAPHPRDEYGRSKWRAEQVIAEICAATRMEHVIVRPPLVYGPGVKANFLRLMIWVDEERLMPLGAVDNLRSLVSIWNLVDLLRLAVSHPAAAGRVWLVSDGVDLSTPQLIRRIGAAMQRNVRLLRVPVLALRLGGWLARRPEISRLCGSLTVDASPARELLGWSAPVTVDQSLERTVGWYLSEGRSRAR